MFKTVFFDLYNTLVRYEPPREQIQVEALKEFGISADAEAFLWPLVAADEFMYQEMARLPLSQRSESDRMALCGRSDGEVRSACCGGWRFPAL